MLSPARSSIGASGLQLDPYRVTRGLADVAQLVQARLAPINGSELALRSHPIVIGTAMLKAAAAQKTGAPVPPLGMWTSIDCQRVVSGEHKPPSDDDDLVQIMLVAGARNQRYLQLWSGAA